MKKTLFLFLLSNFCYINISFTQGVWTWMHGDNTKSGIGVFGTKGVSSPANKPGARYESAEWIDSQGNLWLFGCHFINDMWRYNIVMNEWTWMHGDNIYNQSGVYGTKTVSSPSNKPGCKGFGASTWVDNNGNLWLFGGGSLGDRYNDLWKYNPVINEWTWMHGSTLTNQKGTYGNKGVSAAANTPGCRWETACTWVDNAGNLWLFGGVGYDANKVFGYLNDLWIYDTANNQWVWISGDDIADNKGVYGTMGMPSATNKPGGRMIFTSWTDANGDLWLFGGAGYDANGTLGMLNDIWKYSITNNEWTWINGSDTAGAPASYGIQCAESPANSPSGRSETRAHWKDDCGNIWIFGGENLGAKHNDLWKYNPASNQWAWIGGSNLQSQTGVYGTLGIAAPGNLPGGRSGAVAWKDQTDFWLFGGSGYAGSGSQGNLNDLWKYSPDKPVAGFSANTFTGCAPLSISFNNTSLSNCNEIKSYTWNFGDPSSGTDNSSTQANPSHLFTTPGTYQVKLIVTNCTGSTDSLIQTVIADSLPDAAVSPDDTLCEGESITLNANGGSVYLWSTGSSSSSITISPSASTTYSVTVGNIYCSDSGFVDITVHPSPYVDAGSDTTIAEGSIITLSSSGTGTYSWYPSDGLSCTNCPSPVASPGQTTTYYLTLTDANGCTTVDSITVTTTSNINLSCNGLFVPNAFSPDNNGENELECVYGTCIKDFLFTIYNRWGEIVFQASDQKKCWDGTYKGKALDTDVFAYYLQATLTSGETITRQGNISLIR